MNYQEKKEVILKVWEKAIKDNKNTYQSWQNHWRSFLRWSISKVKSKTYQLYIKNESFPNTITVSNLEWGEKDNKRVLVKKQSKRGRPRK